MFLKLAIHAGRLRKCTAGKGKYRETAAAYLSIDKATLRLSLFECLVYDLTGKSAWACCRLGPEHEVNI